ncbi:Calponin-3 [Frankliniella fusca]|uniref:Calponin-3 n=1 Tax=Frankliniella fusca TaxID=407009 RepID=A0AAE1H0B8_9NEOP|nr:Calponin-3 [Frankliniella fusca]
METVRRGLLLLLCLLLVVTLAAGKRVKRQHNLYSVGDFIGQLGQLAALSQSQGGGGAPSNYLTGLLQGYQQSAQAGYPQGFPQRPARPIPPEYLQDLQYQGQYPNKYQGQYQGQYPSQYQGQYPNQYQGQGVLGFDPVNGGFGYRPGAGAGGGVLGGPGAGAGGLLGGVLGGLSGLVPRPPSTPGGGAVPLATALQSVAQYDDAQCVPRLLCELTAGGRPGGGSRQGEQALPFVNRDTLVSLLTVLNFGSGSPLLVFGRAALLGYTAQGDPASCYSAYPACPRDPDRLVDYLNNYNGGFFRFFTGVGSAQYQQQQQFYRPGPHRPGAGYAGYAPQYRDYAPAASASAATKPVVFPRAESRILTRPHPAEAAAAAGGELLQPQPEYFLPTPRPEYHRQQKYLSVPGGVVGTNEVVYVNGRYVPAGAYFGGAALPASTERPYIPSIPLRKPARPVDIYPTRTGTGDLRLDADDHLRLQGRPQGRPPGRPFTFREDPDGDPYRDQLRGDGYTQVQGQRTGYGLRFPGQDRS